jgi:hypothetical protein
MHIVLTVTVEVSCPTSEVPSFVEIEVPLDAKQDVLSATISLALENLVRSLRRENQSLGLISFTQKVVY